MAIEPKKSDKSKTLEYKDKAKPFFQRGQRRVGQRTSVYNQCSVDIIIPYHGQYHLVRRALKAILQYTRSNPYLVTLVDDGSKGEAAEEFFDTIEQAPQTQCIKLEEHSGFGAAVNAGIQATEQPYVCIMHSDCEVRSLSWLTMLGEALIKGKSQNVRLVVPRSDNPGEDEAGFLKANANDYCDDLISPDPLPFYCAMCHRELFNRIGPLKPYPYTWFENEEFFYRMRSRGFHQGIAGRSWIHHEGSSTVKALWKKQPETEKTMLENRNRCLADIRSLPKQ